MDCLDSKEEVCYAAASVPTNLVSRQPDYRNYKDRLASFANWPFEFIVSKSQLAKSGFYNLNSEDRVRCFACKIVLHKWSLFDNVDIEHHQYSPNCSYIRMTGH